MADRDVYLLDTVSATEAQTMRFAELSQSLLRLHQSACDLGREVPAVVLLKWEKLIEILEQKIGSPVVWEPYPTAPPQRPELPSDKSRRARKKRRALLEAYEKDLAAFNQSKTEWYQGRMPQSECIRINREREDLKQIAANRRKELVAFRDGDDSPRTRSLKWELLPRGRWPRNVISAEGVFPAMPQKNQCPERLLHAHELRPVNVYRGIGDFERYCAFEYSTTSRVLLESPDDGNAAYILKRNWKFLSRLTKCELSTLHIQDVVRVIHRSDSNWRFSIRRALLV